MYNILLIFTGGTIGSTIEKHVINTDPANQYTLIDLYRKKYPRASEIQFQTLAPYEILSENLVPNHWEKLIAAIDETDHSLYDGIIVTHGTDTLAYSACALSFAYAQVKLPLVLVSSNFTLADSRANGLDNFNAAIEFIIQKQQTGVFVAYRNQKQNVKIHLGSRLSSCFPLDDTFMSIQDKTYLEFDDQKFIELNPFPNSLTANPHILPSSLQFSSSILLIKPYPGLNYNFFNLQDVQVIVHDLYHSGTACITDNWGQQHSLIKFISHCRAQGISFYLAPALISENTYITTQLMLDAGARMIWNTSIEAAYVKLSLAYGAIDDTQARQYFIDQNIAHEQLESTIV